MTGLANTKLMLDFLDRSGLHGGARRYLTQETWMRKLTFAALFLCLFPCCFGQLSQEQKIADFNNLVALYNRNYAPLDWKIKVFNFNALDVQPWLEQVRASSDDLSYYDICIRYVASLHDSHDEFTLSADYEAYLPLTADIYDGKVLIDYVDTTALDPSSYPIQIGDELVSVDGTSVSDWVNALAPYAVNGRANTVSTNRLAVGTILDRYQPWYTWAAKVKPGDTAVLRIKNQTTGKISSYTIGWQTIGIPLFHEGPISTAGGFGGGGFGSGHGRYRSLREQGKAANNKWGLWTGPVPAPRASTVPPAHMFSALHAGHVLAGGIYPFDPFFPAFNPPPGFQLRLGAAATDNFVSGTFPVGNQTVGFIRIPTFEPSDEGYALQQFQAEITYFQQNTSGLVIDVMNNGGGDICYTDAMLQYLFPKPFLGSNLTPRPSEQWVENYAIDLADAELEGAPPSVLEAYASYASEIQHGLNQNLRVVKSPVPVCSDSLTLPPATDANGNNLAYTKPILLLTTNFTLSAAEIFSASLQDAGRATVYGVRTDGGGGNVVSYNGTTYSEGNARVTQSFVIRSRVVTTPGFPSAPYIENIGVYPDIPADFQTRANLFTGGQPFVAGFSQSIFKLITTGQP
jgi:Peptidase family S41/PDZ domain